jgi:hypothetical protein
MKGPARPTDGFSLVKVFNAITTSEGSQDPSHGEGGDVFGSALDFVGALHRVIGALVANGWRCKAILKPYQSFDAQLSSATQHSLTAPLVVIPSNIDPSCYPLRMVCRLFDADIDELDPADRLVCETHIVDTMAIFDFDHEEVRTQILDFLQDFAWLVM